MRGVRVNGKRDVVEAEQAGDREAALGRVGGGESLGGVAKSEHTGRLRAPECGNGIMLLHATAIRDWPRWIPAFAGMTTPSPPTCSNETMDSRVRGKNDSVREVIPLLPPHAFPAHDRRQRDVQQRGRTKRVQ